MKVYFTSFLFIFLAIHTRAQLSIDDHQHLKLIKSIKPTDKNFEFYKTFLNSDPDSYHQGGALVTNYLRNGNIYGLVNLDSIIDYKIPVNGNISLCTTAGAEGYDKILLNKTQGKLVGINLKTAQVVFNIPDSENPFLNQPGKILYADDAVMFFFSDSTGKKLNDQLGISEHSYRIFKFDRIGHRKTLFFNNVIVNNHFQIAQNINFSIDKINHDEFLLAAIQTFKFPDGRISLSARIQKFNSGFDFPNGATFFSIENSSFNKIFNDDNSRLSFLIYPVGALSPQFKADNLPLQRNIIAVESDGLHFEKYNDDPHLDNSSILSAGTYYYIFTGGFYYISKDLANYFLLASSDASSRFINNLYYLPNIGLYLSFKKTGSDINIYEVDMGKIFIK